MHRNKYSIFLAALLFALPMSGALIAGCSNNAAQTTAENPGGPPGQMGGPGGPGGPGGRMGGPGGRGGRFAPVAATAKAPEIFQQKCAGCHGENGQGKMGPNLTKKANEPDDELYKVIHNGEGKMPAFANQMTDAQIKELVTYVKGLGKA